MKTSLAVAGLLMGAVSFAVLCQADPPPRVVVPAADDPKAYQPVPMPKQLPMEPPPEAQTAVLPCPPIRNEELFLKAYAEHHNPRIMVFVNRTVMGEKEGAKEVQRVEVKEKATGAVDTKSEDSSTSAGQTTSSGYTGGTASNTNTNNSSSGSFKTEGPAEYSKTTSVKVAPPAYDSIGASAADYEMIEASLVKYFDNSGKVQIKDAQAARAKLDREKIMRIENRDEEAVKLLATELQQDILIQVTATPTNHSEHGPAVRMIARAVSTTDGRLLGIADVDMPLPMVKQTINVYTRYLAGELMGEMTKKWSGVAETAGTVEVRIYKVAGVEDSLKIKKWLLATRGVGGVDTVGAKTNYASFNVKYAGAPEDLYAELKDVIGASQGLKAVNLDSTTINLEVTGQINLITTTKKTETTTTTTEERKVEPVMPAPPQ